MYDTSSMSDRWCGSFKSWAVSFYLLFISRNSCTSFISPENLILKLVFLDVFWQSLIWPVCSWALQVQVTPHLLHRILDLARLCERFFLHHGQDSVVINISLLLLLGCQLIPFFRNVTKGCIGHSQCFSWGLYICTVNGCNSWMINVTIDINQSKLKLKTFISLTP